MFVESFMFTRLVRISLPKNWRRLLLLLFVVVADFVGDGDFVWQRVLADEYLVHFCFSGLFFDGDATHF